MLVSNGPVAQLASPDSIAAADTHEFARRLVEAAPTLFYIYDLEERRNVYIGPQITPLFGYTAAEVRAQGDALVANLFHADDLARIARHHGDILAGRLREPFEIEYRMRHKDGRWLWLASRETVYLRAENGRVKQILGTAQDISARKAAEAALRESEMRAQAHAAQLASVYDTAHVGLCVLDRDLRFRRVNERLAEINGIPAEQHIGRTVREIVPDIAATAERIAEQIFRTGDPVLGIEISGETKARPGEVRHWVEQWVPIKDYDGNVTHISIVADEITERRRAENALRESETRFRTLVDLMPAAMYTCDREGRITLFNQQAAQIWGRSPRLGDLDERFCGSFRLHRMDGTPLAHADTPMAVALRSGAQFRGEEVTIERPDGSSVTVAVNIDPLRDAAGEIVGAVNVFLDVTERKAAEERLLDRNRQLDLLGRTTQRLLLKAAPESELLEAIFGDIAGTIAADSFFHYRPVGAHTLELETAAGVGEDERRLFSTIDFGELLCGRVAQSRSRLIIEDLQNCTFPGAELLHSVGAASYAGFPLVADGELIGTVAFVSRKQTHFRDGDIRTIQLICDQVAITLERWRLQRQVQEAEARQRLLLDNTLAFIGILRTDGTLIEANAPALVAGGLTRGDVVGKKFWDCAWWSYDPEVARRLEGAVARAAAGEIVRYDAVVRIAGDARITIDFMLSPLRDREGNVYAVIPSGFDISERTRAERALKASEARFRATFENAAVGIALVAPDGSWLDMNQRLCAIVGYSAEELRARTFQDITHPDDLESDLAAFREMLTGRSESYSMEKRYIRADGDVVWVELTVGCTREADGSVGYFISVIEDISERKRAEETLRAAHDTFRSLVERSPFGIYVVDADFRLVKVSEGAQKIFQNVRPLIGRELAEVLRVVWPEPFVIETIERFRHTLATGESYHSEQTIEARADISATEAYDWRIDRITLPDGRPGVVCHFYDLSERQRHEQHVRLLMREINHRSKNMLSLVQAIARQSAATSSGDFVQRFDARLLSLASAQDLLVKSEWRAVPLHELVLTQLSHFADIIGTRVVFSGPELSLTPAAAQALGMAFHELATNAAKYGALSNRSGRVDIAWDCRADGAGEPQVTVSWVESGGPPVAQPKHRGFGTTVTTSMVKMGLGGEVEINYAPSGLEWRLACPAANILEQRAERGFKPQAARAVDGRGARSVLVVEDEPLIAIEIAAVLTKAGFEVLGPVGTVAQALDLIADEGCRLAVLDVHLGEETSAPVARKLMATGGRFVIVSGYSVEQLSEPFSGAPLIRKPLFAEALVAEVERLSR